MWIHCVYKNLFFVSDKKHGLYSDSKLQIWKLLYKLAKLDCPKQSKRISNFYFRVQKETLFFILSTMNLGTLTAQSHVKINKTCNK